MRILLLIVFAWIHSIDCGGIMCMTGKYMAYGDNGTAYLDKYIPTREYCESGLCTMRHEIQADNLFAFFYCGSGKPRTDICYYVEKENGHIASHECSCSTPYCNSNHKWSYESKHRDGKFKLSYNELLITLAQRDISLSVPRLVKCQIKEDWIMGDGTEKKINDGTTELCESCMWRKLELTNQQGNLVANGTIASCGDCTSEIPIIGKFNTKDSTICCTKDNCNDFKMRPPKPPPSPPPIIEQKSSSGSAVKTVVGALVAFRCAAQL